MKHLLVSLLLCCAFTVGRSQAQHPELPFEHLTIPGTINSSQVNDLIQDHHGLIWIAGNGLYRYDGYAFNSYRTVSENISIGGQEINCLFSDAYKNRLLLGTHSHGIVSYNYTTETFTPLPSKDGIPIITHIAQPKNGTVWGSSFSNGLFYIENDTIRKYSHHQEKFNSNACLMGMGDKLLVGGNRTIYILQDKKLIDSIYIEFPGLNFPSMTRITALEADPNGKLWVGTEQFGLFVYDLRQKKFIKHFSPEIPPFQNRINKILADRSNRVWILTKSEGIVVYSPETDNFIHIVKNPLSERSISGNNCTAIIQDRTNIIWIGSTGDLNKYDPLKIKFRHIYSNPFAMVSLHDNLVRGVYEGKDKKLWVGTDGGVIHIFDERKLAVEKVEIKLPGKKHIVPFYFLDLTDKIVMIGSSEGLLQFDRTTKKIGYYKPLEQQTKGNQVRQLVIHNNILYFTSYGFLKSYNFKTGAFKVYTTRENPKDVKNTTTLYVDHSNRLWIGVRNGISVYDSITDTFRNFELEQSHSRPLGTYSMVLSLKEFQGKLWIGTFNEGLWSLDLSNLDSASLIHVSKKREVQNMTVYSTIPDDSGNLWMSTNQGITRYTIETDRYTDFSVSEGLQQDEFNRLAHIKCSSGEIVFGGINGLNIFHPKNITIQEDDYTPTLLNIFAFDEHRNQTIPIELGADSTFSLPHDQNDVDFHFFIPNYRNPRRYEVYYTLKGSDLDWVKAETNALHYSNLKPGDYTFQLKTISTSGKEKFASVNFHILLPFWQTWWFIIIVTVVTSFIMITIIQNTLRKTRKDKERLEKLLNERTHEIETSRAELANLNQKKDLIFSILSHDLRSPLTTLKGFLSILIDDQDHLSKEDIKKHATSIRNSVTSSLDLIDNTLFWSLSQTGNIIYTPSYFSLNEMLLKISNLYHLMMEKKKITFNIEMPEEIMIYADENMAYVTLRNIVSNALKFTPPGKTVNITIKTQKPFAIISIKDEGIGMSKAYLEKLLTEEQLALTKGTNDEKGTGLGLILCKKFIQLNYGLLDVKSVEGEGTEFTVSLPLQPQDLVK